jgi:hypothetical protein
MFLQMKDHAWTEARNQEPRRAWSRSGGLGAWRIASGARISTPSARRNLEPREPKHKIEILPGCSKSANEATKNCGDNALN